MQGLRYPFHFRAKHENHTFDARASSIFPHPPDILPQQRLFPSLLAFSKPPYYYPADRIAIQAYANVTLVQVRNGSRYMCHLVLQVSPWVRTGRRDAVDVRWQDIFVIAGRDRDESPAEVNVHKIPSPT